MIIRIFGLHKMKIYESKSKVRKLFIVIMGNLFHTKHEIYVRYDLKGSKYGWSSR